MCPNLPSKNTQAGRLNIYASLAGKLVMAHVLDLLRLAGFDLKAVEAICEAYSKARKSLHDTGDHDLVNEIIALRILSLAKQGERDPDRLRAGALAALPITSASLIGRSGSSAFRLSTTSVSMSLAGSCFSSDSAPRPFQCGIRERGGTIYWSALPSDGRQVQADIRTHLIHRPARDIFPPLGGARVFSYCI